MGQPKLSPSLLDRKSTRLNSSHLRISYAVFCLKKKIDVVRGKVQIAGQAELKPPGATRTDARLNLSHALRVQFCLILFFLIRGRRPGYTLFPYTALFL